MSLLWVVERDGTGPKVSTANEEAKLYPRVANVASDATSSSWDQCNFGDRQKRSRSQTISSLDKLLFYLLAIVFPSLEKLTLHKCCMAAAQ